MTSSLCRERTELCRFEAACEERPRGQAHTPSPGVVRVELAVPRRKKRRIVGRDDEAQFDVRRETDRDPVTAAGVVHRPHHAAHVLVAGPPVAISTL